jgi:1-acyl-sn-glycerol-3-phosphate acyltransferase
MGQPANLPGHPLGRKIAWFLGRILMNLLLRVDLTGLENVPRTGPVIVVINHIAWLDPIVVCGCFPRLVTPMAKKEIFELPLLHFLLNLYGTIPVHRGEADLAAVKMALRVLQSGGVILLAPEGTRSPTKQLQAGKAGTILLALRSKATIVPVGVTGTEQLKGYWQRLKRGRISVSIGKPFQFCPSDPAGRVSRMETEAMITEAMYRLAAELPPEYRGVYQNMAEATETYLTQVAIQR